MNYKIIYLLCVIGTLTVAQNATICDEEELNSFIPNVRDCNAWFRCGLHGPEPGNCPREFNFNPLTRFCDFPQNFECFKCPSEAISTHSMDRSCRSFIRCIDGVAVQHMCTSGLQFNDVTGQCDLESVVQCSVRFRCPDRLPIDGSIIAIRDPQNCSIYYICAGESDPIRQECNPELHFDPDTGLCTFPKYTDCNTDPEGEIPEKPEEPGFICSTDGTHPHPSSCTMYFICANRQPHPFSCSGGLHFNETTEQCDRPEIVNCDRENFRTNYYN